MTTKLNVTLIPEHLLCKGSTLPASLLEQVTGTQRNSSNYSLALLRVRNWIEGRMLEKIEQEVSLCALGSDLRILTDAEASGYQHQEFFRGIRKIRRAARKTRSIDTSNLSYAEHEQHQRNAQVQGFYLTAIALAKKQDRAFLRPGAARVSSNPDEDR